ncbi:MAG: hypothetical protein Q9160_003652 [Pyrenula sp. 1 TL-2023]
MPNVQLRYLEWNPVYLTEKPYQIITNVPEGCPTTNLSFRTFKEEQIHNVRGDESEYKLDDHGFTFLKHELVMEDFSTCNVERQYIPLMSRWLRDNIKDVHEVFVFDWRLRSSNETKTSVAPDAEVDLNDLGQYIKPVETVHVGMLPYVPNGRLLSNTHAAFRPKSRWSSSTGKSSHGPRGGGLDASSL